MGSDDAIDASVVDNYYNVDENDGLSYKKNEKRYKQKIVSELGEILKHLTGECKECEEDGESDSTAVIETDPVYTEIQIKRKQAATQPSPLSCPPCPTCPSTWSRGTGSSLGMMRG